MAQLIVSETFQGIDGIAHGGYLAGMISEDRPEVMQVTLRRPPPLNRPLFVEDGAGQASLVDRDGQTIMEAAPGDLTANLPSITAEEVNGEPNPRFERHPYPHCFVCGTEHPNGFNLRFSTPDEHGHTLATWIPSGRLIPEIETVPDRFVWAVIDCLSAWSFSDHWDDSDWWPAVTGQIAVEIRRPVLRDETHVLVAHPTGREGKRIYVEAAIHDAEGDLCARGESTWITVPAPPSVD